MAKKKLSEEIRRQLDDEWLNLNPNTPIINPFERLKTEDPEEFYKRLTCLFLNPDYIYFVCKHVLNVELLPMQALILQEMWQRKFPMLVATRGFGKTFLTSLYCLLRALLIPGRKIVVVGAAFRQSKFLHEYMSNIWKNAPVLRDMCSADSGPRASVDMCRMIVGASTVTSIPVGDGQKIRGLRANDIVADEFGCISKGSLVETKHGLIRIEDTENGFDILTGDSNYSENPIKYIKTKLRDVYRITMKNGYVIDCSDIHQLKTSNGWKDTLSIKAGDYIERSPQEMIFGNYNLDPKMSWFMGILVSEGCVTRKDMVSITTTDENLSNKLINEYGFKMNTRKEYVDHRGWKCKKSYVLYRYDQELRQKLYELGIDYVTAHNKKIPHSILMSNKETIRAFLKGLFDGDGSAFLWKDRDILNNLGLSYYSVSERLCRDVQVLMYKLGYDGYIVSRESKISEKPQWMVRWNNNIAIKACEFLGVERFSESVINCCVREDISNVRFYRGKYVVEMTILGKRIHKQFNNEEDAKLFVSNQKSIQYQKVLKIEKLPDQQILYDYCLPESHSFYADGFRNHNSHSREIFENVIAGFAAVSANPVENVKNFARQRAAERLGIDLNEYDERTTADTSNQIILSGTAYYDFNHFAEYWKKWRSIILTGGDEKLLSTNVFNGEPVPESFNWKDYSIIRIPVDLAPRKFMDEGQVARSKATVHNGIYLMEFAACFTTDSQGFFKRSLIESCVGTDSKPIHIGDESIYFDPLLKGNKNRKYVMAIDPASEVDNFSIIILELHGTHRRIVHCWTTTRSDHTEKVAKGITKVNNFYSYCARKIRDLMKLFNIVHIAMDSQGGGYSVSEALHDLTQLEDGEIPIWPIIDPEKEAPTDDQPGLHILEMCQFANYEWYSEANHGLRKDLENKTILFPRFDPITIGLSIEEDSANNRLYDTLEDCVMEIEELKNELSMIEITQSVNGRERWDTPEVKVGVSKKKRLRKDRYSALIMANLSARKIDIDAKPSEYHSYGGFSSRSEGKRQEGATYEGPNWFTSKINNLY